MPSVVREHTAALIHQFHQQTQDEGSPEPMFMTQGRVQDGVCLHLRPQHRQQSLLECLKGEKSEEPKQGWLTEPRVPWVVAMLPEEEGAGDGEQGCALQKPSGGAWILFNP